MTAEEWITKEDVIERSRRTYAHFDYRTDLAKAKNYVTDPEKVAHHGFYPFIHYTQVFIKYSKTEGQKEKRREICYAAHIDRCIYQYYNHLLDEMYIQRVHQDDISDCAVAYRSDLRKGNASGPGKNNIEFSHTVFSFIREHAPCYVMIGDFTNFFDSLDHTYLKERLCDLLGVPRLPPDYYAVFKNITRYSTWELSDLLALNKISSLREMNRMARVVSPEAFRENRKKYVKPNPNQYGIPQGSPISALLANVYMLACDKAIKEAVSNKGGLYMRYSDDFCIVLPAKEDGEARDFFEKIKGILGTVKNLKLQPEKTQYFYFDGACVENVGTEFEQSANRDHRFINFLGFTFDGTHIHIRDKTITKYYYRMGKKAKTIVKQRRRGKRPSLHNLYMLYSQKGARVGRGNFITYVARAQKEFGSAEPIDRPVKSHLVKIRKKLKTTRKK